MGCCSGVHTKAIFLAVLAGACVITCVCVDACVAYPEFCVG